MTRSALKTRSGTGFGYLWSGECASLLGNATSAFLVPVLALVQLDAGPLWIGLLTAAAWLPWVTVGLLAGALIDRRAPKPVIITANVTAAVALLTLLYQGLERFVGRRPRLALAVAAVLLAAAVAVFVGALASP